jgi:RNA polymerase sigma-B factor
MPDPRQQRQDELFAELARSGSIEARNELVELFSPLAEYFTSRYRPNASSNEDLGQVAQMALVNAVDRFDPTLGIKFSTFAGRTIDGELKRYFRDRTWSVRVPRRLKEVAVEIRALVDLLSADLGRAPTVDELCERSGYDADTVLRALDIQSARTARSLDGSADDDDTTAHAITSALSEDDANFDRTDVKLTLRELLGRLDERSRTIVELRFYQELTQQEIAEQIGLSQMHVSRLLRSALEQLRSHYQYSDGE